MCIRDSVGNAPVLALLSAIAEKNTAAALSALDAVYNASKDMGVLCSELAEMFRNLLVVKYACLLYTSGVSVATHDD